MKICKMSVETDNMNIEFDSAKKGREIWLSLTKRYEINNQMYVIICPSKKRKYNEPALKYLRTFLSKRGVKRALVIYCDEWVSSKKKDYEDIASFVNISREEIEALIRFYELYEFAQNIVIASLEEPSGRMGDNLVGIKNLNSDEVFAGIVYSLVD